MAIRSASPAAPLVSVEPTIVTSPGRAGLTGRLLQALEHHHSQTMGCQVASLTYFSRHHSCISAQLRVANDTETGTSSTHRPYYLHHHIFYLDRILHAALSPCPAMAYVGTRPVHFALFLSATSRKSIFPFH